MAAPQLRPEPTDAELVTAFKAGNAAAFDDLHRRYVASIFRLVHRALGDGQLAEDIAQETFIRSLRVLDRVDDDFNFGGWVHTVAQNLCRDELRRRMRDPRVHQGPETNPERELMVRLPAPAKTSDPALAFETRELRRQVWRVAQKLPEKYRLVLTLRELQGLSYRQIAVALGISESAVETLVYRARLRFKEEFVADQGGPELECADVRPMLAPYLAGKLRVAQSEAVRVHVAGCVACSRKLRGRKRQPTVSLSSMETVSEEDT